MFTLKKAKKLIGEFSSNDRYEWTLLCKPEIQNVTKFVHLHRMWLREEKPEIIADEEKGIKGKAAIVKIPICEAFIGFIKDGKFIIERQMLLIKEKDEIPAQIKFISILENYQTSGFKKDWNEYKGDIPKIPGYYSKGEDVTDNSGTLPQIKSQVIKAGSLFNKLLTTVGIGQSGIMNTKKKL